MKIKRKLTLETEANKPQNNKKLTLTQKSRGKKLKLSKHKTFTQDTNLHSSKPSLNGNNNSY
jgi:hypothetical protein